MSGCTERGKPLIAILMAVYEPRMDWLKEQLESLEKQTYPNLKLYVRDDCSRAVPFEEIEGCVRNCIRSFPYEIQRNKENLGSNRTFERLTEEAEGNYFAFCDQDDVWLPDKLTVLQEELEHTGALLACSDMFIMDGDGEQVADSITKVRRRHKFYSGSGFAEKLLLHNFVTGCAMLVRSETAKAAVSFCPYMHHDHYLALWCAENGRIQSVLKPLIRYRLHGNNQTSRLSGIYDKKSYGQLRIVEERLCAVWLLEHFPCGGSLREAIQEELEWIDARIRNWEHRGGKRTVWKYRHLSKLAAMAELLTAELPEPIFKLFLAVWKDVLK